MRYDTLPRRLTCVTAIDFPPPCYTSVMVAVFLVANSTKLNTRQRGPSGALAPRQTFLPRVFLVAVIRASGKTATRRLFQYVVRRNTNLLYKLMT